MAMRKNLEAICVGALTLLWWITCRALYGPDHLPARIPTHFNFAGQPNGWGSPYTLLVPPIIAVGVYALITVITQFSSLFNYPVRVTDENRPRLEALAQLMITWIKTESICLLAWIQWSIIEGTRQRCWNLSPVSVLISILVILMTIGWYLLAMRRAARPEAGM
jgi:uncharacterized membrane protein